METRALVRISLLAATIAALGLIPRIDLPIAAGVPITAQSMGVMLAGALLGARQGALAVLLFVFVALLGAPLLAGGRGGLGVLFGPSAGYLIGYIFGAFVTGLIFHRTQRLPGIWGTVIAAVIGGILVVHLFGITVLAWRANMTLLQATLASAVFVPGDLVKAVLAGFVVDAARRAMPSAFPRRA